MARMQPPVVAIVGNIEHREFAAPLVWLRESTRLACFETCSQAADAIGSGSVLPSWILLAAAARGAFARREVERLHRRAPLTRLVALLGSWCEGETRSGAPLAGISRVYWHEFVARAEAELLGPPRSGYAGWWLPRTSTAVDLAMTIERRVPRKAARSLAIIAPTRDRFESLADAALGCGFSSDWLRGDASIDPQSVALLYDGDSLSDLVASDLRQLVARSSGRPIFGLLHFPRLQEVALAKELGLAGVLPKPFLIGDLAAQLSQLLPAGRRSTAA